MISIGLALAFPLGSLVMINAGTFNPVWLSLPDLLIGLALLQGLKADKTYWLFLVGFFLTLLLSILSPSKSALFPGFIFLVVSRYFYRSLCGDQTPLITQMARRIRGPTTPFSEAAGRYTRSLTRVWWLLFMMLGLNQLLLAWMTDGRWAWLMGNSLAPALIFLFLIVEPLYRRHLLPNEPHHSLRHFFTRLAEIDWKGMN